MSNSKPHQLQFIKPFHEITKQGKLKIPFEKSFFMLLTEKYPGQQTGFKTFKSNKSKFAAIH